jgi:hypothetical protein
MMTHRRSLRGRAAAAVAGLAALLLLASGCDRDGRALSGQWESLRGTPGTAVFSPEMVADLPEPARRYLVRAIAPGTPLATAVELEMRGQLLLEPGGDPLDMIAHQILAPPDGFIWRADARRGLLRIIGFDRYVGGEGEMRWRAYGLVPVLRETGDDVTRSAAGRLAMEAVLMPAALVPGRGARWEPVDDHTARFHITIGNETMVTALTVDADGRPLRASAMRWRGDLPGGAGYARFDVEMDGELTTGGYTIPRRVQAGWALDADDGFRFFDATLQQAEFR